MPTINLFKQQVRLQAPGVQKLSLTLLMFASLFALGCSPDATTNEKASVIPEHQLKVLEQAKQTDDLLKEAEKQRQKQLE